LPYTSTKLGISLHREDRVEFPSASTSWCPDCLCQKADLKSLYTQSLIKKDIPYVAGPSGMTTLFSSAMLLLGQFDSVEEHNHYILAIASFITGGGLHSIHEVLTVPHVRLGLIEAYNPYGDKAGNYQAFFELFSLDDTVIHHLNSAWKSTISWLCKLYPELTTKASYGLETTMAPALQPPVKTDIIEKGGSCACM
jgi:hypothetical protein